MSDSLITRENTGVIVVDVQADFTELKAGALAVPGTDADYIDDALAATRRFQGPGAAKLFHPGLASG